MTDNHPMTSEDRRRLLLSRIVTGSQLDRQDFPPLEWIVPGIVPEGYGLLVGPPKVGKSWLTLSLGLSVALGGTALGALDVDPRPVLLLALEDGFRRLQDRSRTLLAGEPIPDRLHMYVEPGPDVLQEVLPGWLEQYGPQRPLVILDTLGTVQPQKLAGESEYQRDYRTGQMLKGFIHDYPGSALLVVHHTRKMGSDDWMDSTSGTNGVNGSADFTVALAAERESSSGVLSVTGRDVQAGSYAVCFDAGSWRLEGDGLASAAEAARAIRAKSGLSEDHAAIVSALQASADPLGPKAIAESTGMDEKKVGVYLSRLVNSGRVDKLGRGLYMLPLGEGVGSVGLLGSDAEANQQPNTTNTPTGGTGLGRDTGTAGTAPMSPLEKKKAA